MEWFIYLLIFCGGAAVGVLFFLFLTLGGPDIWD